MRIHRLVLARPVLALIAVLLAPMTTALIHTVRAQQAPQEPKDPSPLYVIEFVDFAGGAQVTAEGTQELQQYVADTRKDPGNLSCEPLVQLGRANHLMIIEVWQNRAAFDKHESADHTKTFRANIVAKLGAPFDQRLHYVLK